MNSTLRKVALITLRFGVGIAMLVWLNRSGALSLHSLSAAFRTWPITLAAVAILLFDLFLMAVRVSLLFRVQKLTLTLGNALRLTLLGFLFSMVLPGTAGGEIAKFYYAGRDNHGRRAEIAASLLFDRLLGLLSMLLLPLMLAPFFSQVIRSTVPVQRILWMDALLVAGLLSAMAVVLFSKPLCDLASAGLKRWPSVQSLWNRVVQALLAYKGSGGTVISALALSLLANFAFIVVTALGFYTTNPHGFSLRTIFLAPIGYLINALPLTPGGLGIGEAAFNALFSLIGISGGADALLCVRCWNVIVGLFGVVIYLYGLGRVVHVEGSPVVKDAGELVSVEAVRTPQFDGN
jgi:uncharacterized protein (TIRG00374 family)